MGSACISFILDRKSQVECSDHDGEVDRTRACWVADLNTLHPI